MNNKQIKIGAVLSYFSIALNILSGLIYTPWMIHQIGKSQYGLFTLANSLISIFLIDFGLSAATARYVSKYHAEGNQDKANRFLAAIYKLYIVVDAVILTVLTVIYFCIDSIYVKLTPAELMQFKIVYVIAGGYAVFSFPFVTLNGILTAYEKFIQLKLADVLYRILVVGLMVFALLNGYGLYALVTVNALAGFVLILYKYIIIRRVTPVRVNFRAKDKGMYKEIFAFSFWVTISTVAQRLIFNITPSILGIVANSAAIAVFGVITTIEAYSYSIASAINGMFMPKISRIYSGSDSEEKIMPLMLKVGRFQYALNGLIVIGFAVIGKQFINLWMGSDYADAYYGILLVIIPGMFFNALQIGNTAMTVQKKVNIQAYIAVAAGVFNVVCSLILSKYFGVIGASFSIFMAYMLRALLFSVAFYKVLHLDIPQFARKCYIGMFPFMLLSLVAGLAVNRIIPLGGWFGLTVKACAVIAFYLVFLWLLGLDKTERAGICSAITTRLKR